ncbi:MAG: hypothetical protein JSS53_09260 [Proteobacteria bacterium]|nr:hypothetical protein [Pseudomonadota bacterium]
MKYIKKERISGIGQTEREFLSKLLRATKITISVSEAANILGLKQDQAAKILARYNKKGWLKRIQQGVYLPVPITSLTSDIVAEDPFVIAEKLFSPCYIGGTNAANYWDLTEQIFRTTTIMTQKMVRNRKSKIAGNEYLIHTLKPLYFFGLKTVWLNDIKIKISDPTRTIVDMLMFPSFCGGLNFIIEVLQNYYRSQYKDMDLLINYLETAKNGAAIKRFGFLVDIYFPNEKKVIDYCLKNLTQGYVKLSPSLDCSKLIRRWRLWVPKNWKRKFYDK